MKPIKVNAIGALVVAIAIAIAAYAGARSSDAGAGPVASAYEALAVQGEIQTAGLPQRLEAALGGDFGGLWYDQGTAQLHVGVTSAASRAAAEAVAAEAGLAAHVTATPVRSTWAELQAEQERLGRRLADLAGWAGVSTGLRPQENAVHVELGSAVPEQRHAELEGVVASAPVDVLVTEASVPRLQILREACEYTPSNAHCDPSIVAGVSIESESKVACTAGPTAIRQDLSTPEKATKTFLLTAGHCIQKGGGDGQNWYAYIPDPKNGPKKTLIGKSYTWVNSEVDFGVIEIDPASSWLLKGSTPVNPAVAPWKNPNPTPEAVAGETPSVVGNKSCFSGQVSGTECGKIAEINREYTWMTGDKKTSKGLTVVDGVASFEGDSGGPWFSEASASLLEGTHVGTINTGQRVFHPLSQSFAKLVLKLQLLTVFNEERHPTKFHAKAAEATVTSTADGTGKTAHHVFDAAGGNVTCSGIALEGQTTEVASALTVSASYSGCTFLGSSATVSMGGCAYLLHSSGEFDIVSKAGKNCATEPIKWEAAGCKIEVPPQSARELLTYHNVKPASVSEITMQMNLTGLTYKSSGTCPKTGELSDGAYTTGNTILTAAKAGAMVDYSWE